MVVGRGTRGHLSYSSSLRPCYPMLYHLPYHTGQHYSVPLFYRGSLTKGVLSNINRNTSVQTFQHRSHLSGYPFLRPWPQTWRTSSLPASPHCRTTGSAHVTQFPREVQVFWVVIWIESRQSSPSESSDPHHVQIFPITCTLNMTLEVIIGVFKLSKDWEPHHKSVQMEHESFHYLERGLVEE